MKTVGKNGGMGEKGCEGHLLWGVVVAEVVESG